MSLTGKVFKLANGNTIPALAYGTGTKWFKRGSNTDIDQTLVDTLVKAIKLGVTHIDGAEIYKTDREIGLALKQANVKREDIFVSDKHFSGDNKYEDRSKEANPYESLKASLKRLQLDYVDLYLLHSQNIKKETHGYSLVEAWNYLEKLHDEGLAKNIGVSNFDKQHLQEIFDSNPKHKPVINQIEFSAYLQEVSPGIVEFSKKNGILLEAYGPLGPITKGGPGPIDAVVEKLSKKYNKTDSQILLRWVLQNGILPVTTSGKAERITSNLEILDFELSAEDVKEITEEGKKKNYRQFHSL